jgi:(E)-4-hydroxy-3-methylbut-2-enyl-diphosphate synthase
MGSKGIVASTAALSVLLQEGIGDTIRISLTPEPGGSRSAGSHRRPGDPADHGPARLHADGRGLPGLRADDQHLLPGTGRRGAGFRARPNAGMEAALRRCREHDAGRHGLHRQWPGESKHANIGISLPGTGEAPSAPVYEDGEKTVTLKGDHIAGEFKDIIERYVRRTYKKKLQA